MSKKFISKSYDSSESLDLVSWQDENNWSYGHEFDTFDDDFRDTVKKRACNSILNIKELYTETDGKKNGVYERYYNNLITFNELVLNDPNVKLKIKEYGNFDSDNHNKNYQSPNDLVHNEHTDSWDEPSMEQQLSRIEENVNYEQSLIEDQNNIEASIQYYQDKVFDKYMDLLICKKPKSWIFGNNNKYELVRNFPMLVGKYKDGIKTGDWFYHSFNSDLIVRFSYRNPEHDVRYKDDTNGQIHLISFLSTDDTPNLLNEKINDWDLGVELSHFDDDNLSIEKFIKFDWKNRFNREKVFTFLRNFKHKDVSYTGAREDDLPF